MRKPGLRTLLSVVFGGLVLLTAAVTLAIVGVAGGDAAFGDAIDKGRQAQAVLSERIGAELSAVERAARLYSRQPEGSADGEAIFSLVPIAELQPAKPAMPDGWSIAQGRPIYRVANAPTVAAVDLVALRRTMEALMQEGVSAVLLHDGRVIARTASGGRIDEASTDELTAIFAAPFDPDDVPDEAPTLRRVVRTTDEPVFLSSEPLPTPNLDLRVGFATTPSTVAGSIAQIGTAMLVAGLIALLAVAAALFISKRVAGAVGGVRDALHDIAALDLDRATPIEPMPARELEDIRLALDRALRSLKAFERFVPKSLVLRLLERGDGSLRLAEERDVSVLFTDIAGFTALAAAMRPEEVTALLDRHFEVVSAAVERTGGTVDKYVGDGILAYWGAPEPLADHAARALEAARAIQTAHLEDVARGETGFGLRIGVHCGPVIAGTVGTAARLDYTIVGDTVNVASRLEQLGREIDPDCACCALVSGTAHDRARRDGMEGADCEELGPHALRGRDGAVAVWRL